jgi:hypothetical protein
MSDKRTKCFVCSVEDAMGAMRGSQSHPFDCTWRIVKEQGELLDLRIALATVTAERDAAVAELAASSLRIAALEESVSGCAQRVRLVGAERDAAQAEAEALRVALSELSLAEAVCDDGDARLIAARQETCAALATPGPGAAYAARVAALVEVATMARDWLHGMGYGPRIVEQLNTALAGLGEGK